MSEQLEALEFLQFDVTITSEDGVIIPLKLRLSYPTDFGVYALQHLNDLSTKLKDTEVSQAFLSKLIADNDLSVMQRLNIAQGDVMNSVAEMAENNE